MTPKRQGAIDMANTPQGKNVSDLQSLTQSVDFWNTAMIWSLVFAAIAAVAVVATTRIALSRAKRLGEVQAELGEAKERRLMLDLRDKDEKIAQADLARAKIEESIAWRRLTRRQQSEIASSVKRFAGHTVSLWYGAGDKESETLAMELATAFYNGQWRVFRPAAMLTLAQGGLPFSESAAGTATGVSVSGPADDAGHALSDAIVRELTDRGFDAIRAADSSRPKPDDAVFRIEVNVRPEGPQGEAKLRSLSPH